MGTGRVAFLSYFATDESTATREVAGNSALISVVTIDIVGFCRGMPVACTNRWVSTFECVYH